MPQTGPIDTSFPDGDISRMVKHNHMQIMALFQVYLGSPHDSRQAIQGTNSSPTRIAFGQGEGAPIPGDSKVGAAGRDDCERGRAGKRRNQGYDP